jgi:two-component system cell cycle response regulator DivK
MMHHRILVVEDDPDQRVLFHYWLGRIGAFVILEAANGQEALSQIARQPPDLIIMDLGLPVLDGWETTRRIRALPCPARDIPILAVTAYALAGDEQKALAAGCDDYLAKPVVDFTVLKSKVERLLDCGRGP